jgi:hypothetical protein
VKYKHAGPGGGKKARLKARQTAKAARFFPAATRSEQRHETILNIATC